MRQPPHLPVLKIRRHLAFVIARSKLTQRDIERRLGFTRGHISQLLGGTIDLKLWHVEAILECLEIEPDHFFDELFPHPRHWPWGLPPEWETELTAQGKLLPVLLAILYGFGIEVIEGERRRIEKLEDLLIDLAHSLGEDVTL